MSIQTSSIFSICLVAAVLLLTAPSAGRAAPGDVDLSFGSGGIVTTILGGVPVTQTILTQPDGKIVVCGTIYDKEDDGEVASFLARYHPTGTLDTSFGTNGKVLDDSVRAGKDMALQQDGKIIIVGNGYGEGGLGFAVRRYHANGTPDDSFGARGLVHTGGVGLAESVAIQPDGKMVVAGWRAVDGSDIRGFVVVRYNPNGSLDASFGGTGKVLTPVGGFDQAEKALLQPNGKIVVVGHVGSVDRADSFALVRYNTDGSLDSSFGTGGKVIHAFLTGHHIFNDAALQPDGKIVATGWILDNPVYMAAVVRYNPDGSIDRSFASNGIFTTAASFLFIGYGVALQSNGKILIFGLAGDGSGNTPFGPAVLRLNTNGTPDTGFGTDGRVLMPNLGGFSAGAVQRDGKILAGGTGLLGTSIISVRFLGDAVAPRTTQFDFDGDSRADIGVFRPADRTWYLDRSQAGFSATEFGLSTDQLVPADYDGDGKTDIAVFRDGTWYWLNSSDGVMRQATWGTVDDTPLPADYTGDGRSELAVFRASNRTWFIYDIATGSVSHAFFGIPTDLPVPADYDGDGRTEIAIFRDGRWYLRTSSGAFTTIHFGIPGGTSPGRPVVGDYDGDGKADQAVYRDGTWYLLQSREGFASFQFGTATDVPIPADYDGDGRTDLAVYRDGIWYVSQSSVGFAAVQFGLASDRPVSSVVLSQ